MSIELKPREWLLALWANGTFTVEAEDAPCWQAIAPPAMIRAVAALPMEETIKELRASLAAAEAKLADERKHATQVATVLSDRIHANTIYIGAVAGLNDFHEDATACISHNMEAINATRDLAGCDRSHERWEVEAQARLREIIAESERRAREACAEADADSAARRQEASDERP